MLIKQMFTTTFQMPIKRNILKRAIPIISNNSFKNTIKTSDVKNNQDEKKEEKKVFYPFFGWVSY